MSKQISVKKNFIMNTILSMSGILFPLITFPYVSRVLTPVGTGKVQFATSVIAYFSMFAMLGIPTYGIRACARVRDDKEKLSRTVREIFTINFTMTCLVYAAFLITLAAVPRFRSERALLLVVSATILFNMLGMEWLYKALEQYTYIAVRSLIFKFLALVLMFVCIHEQEDYIVYGALSVLAGVGSNILNFINLRKYIDLRVKGRFEYVRHLKPIVVFFAMSVATTIYTNLDVVMLNFMQGDAQTGYYSAAVKVKTVVLSVVTALGTVLLPRVSYYIEKRMQEEFRQITAKAFNFVIMLAAPIAVFFMFTAKDSILLLSGSAYMGAVLPMQIIMPTVFLIGMTNITGIQILVPMNKEKSVLLSEIAGAVVDLCINFLLIPKYGGAGAAIGTLAAEIVVLLVQVWALRDVIGGMIREVRFLNILLGMGAAVLGILLSMQLRFSHSFTSLLVNGLTFWGSYGIVLLLRREPLIMEILREGKRLIVKK